MGNDDQEGRKAIAEEEYKLDAERAELVKEEADLRRALEDAGAPFPTVEDHAREKLAAILSRRREIAAARLKNAQIEKADAVQLIKSYNDSDCLIYADPPYLGETRGRKRLYRVEMMETAAHIQLLDALINHAGPVIISGYDHQLYNERLAGWRKLTHVGRSNAGGHRRETLWLNYAGEQRTIFDMREATP